jgi:hypothetical protein
MLEYVLPEHNSPVQLADMVSLPMQKRPPLEGAGLVHERLLWCLQSGPQALHGDQVDQRPSMAAAKNTSLKTHGSACVRWRCARRLTSTP